MTNSEELLAIAVRLAPAFRDKFDFSDAKDYARLADHAFLAAKALKAKADEVAAETIKKDSIPV